MRQNASIDIFSNHMMDARADEAKKSTDKVGLHPGAFESPAFFT